MNETPVPEASATAPSEKHELTPEIVQQLTQQVIETLSFEYSRSGPLPSPEEMADYKQVDPKLVDVITQIALAGATYPESRDRKLAETASKMLRSLTALGLGVLGLAAYLAYLGFDIAAVIAAVAPLGAWMMSTMPSLSRRWSQRRKHQPG